MSDLVQKLRATADDTDAVENASVAYLLEEAAAEIERLSQKCDCPVADNAANRDNTLAAHATPSEGIEQSECTLTDAEREAIECGLGEIEGVYPETAATLRGLLERLA